MKVLAERLNEAYIKVDVRRATIAVIRLLADSRNEARTEVQKWIRSRNYGDDARSMDFGDMVDVDAGDAMAALLTKLLELER